MPAARLPKTPDLDRRNAAWFVDKSMQILMFAGGISAIVFIIGIFVFVAREGCRSYSATWTSASFSRRPAGVRRLSTTRPSGRSPSSSGQPA